MLSQDFIPLKVVTLAGEGAAGSTIRLPLANLPKHRDGAPLYLVGLFWDLVVSANTVAVTMPGAVVADHARSAIQQIRIKAAGHEFVSQKNGLDLYLDTFLRLGSGTLGAADDSTGFADADATPAANVLQQYFALNNPRAIDGAKNLDGAIPVAMLANGDAEISMVIGSALQPAFAGVTVTGVAGTFYAVLQPGAKLRIPSPWRLQHYRDVALQFARKLEGAAEYAVIADRETAAGVYGTDQVDYSLVRTSHNGNLLGNTALSATTVARRFSVCQFPHLSAPGAADISLSAPAFYHLLPTIPQGPRSQLPRGELQIQIDARGTRTATSLRTRETGKHDSTSSYWKNALLALGCPTSAQWVARAAASSRKWASRMNDILDSEVWFAVALMRAAGFTVPAASGRS